MVKTLFSVVLVTLGFPTERLIAADLIFDAVVNKNVTVDALTLDDLKQILLANKTAWPDGKRVKIVYLSEDAEKADFIAKGVLSLSATQIKKHYLTKVFSGVLPTAPQSVDSSTEAVELVAKTDGAIAIVVKGTQRDGAKVLDIK